MKKTKKYKQYGNDHDLRMLYLHLNKKYFSNKLPKDMPVRFAATPVNLGTTVIHTQTFRPLFIKISKKLRFSRRLSEGTLLHEMVHVKHPERRGCKDVAFEKEMMALARKGAFRGIW
jgi:hypothetical protein